MAKQRVNVEITATDRTRAALQSVRSGLDNINRTVDRLGKSTSHVDRLVRVLRSNYLSFMALRMGFSGLIGLAKIQIEMQRLQFTFMAARGTMHLAADSMRYVRKVSDHLGLNFLKAAEGLSQLEAAARGANVPLKEARVLWLSVSKATVLYHLDADKVKRVMYALIEMMSEGRIQSRQLRRQLANALPVGIIGRFAHQIALATHNAKFSVLDLTDAMKKGQVTAAKYIPLLAKAIDSAVPVKELNKATHSFLADTNRMKNSWLDLERVVNNAGYVAATDALMRGFTSSVNFLKNNLTTIGRVLKTVFASLVIVIGVHLVTAITKANAVGMALIRTQIELESVMRLLGGPVGIFMVAAIALGSLIYYMVKGKTEAQRLGGSIQGLTGDIKELTSAELLHSISQLETSLSKLQEKWHKGAKEREQDRLNQAHGIAPWRDLVVDEDTKKRNQFLKSEQYIKNNITRFFARLGVLHAKARSLALAQEAKTVIASLVTPLDRYNVALSRLNELLKAGLINQVQFNLAVKKAKKDLSDAKGIGGFGSAADSSKEINKLNTIIGNSQKKLAASAVEVISSIQTPLQKYNLTLARLCVLLKGAYISWTQFNLAAQKATKTLGDARAAAKKAHTKEVFGSFEVYGKEAARSIQQSFANFLFNPLQHGFEGMLIGFANVLRRMVAEVIAAKLAAKLLGSFATTGIMGGALAGVFHQGGVVGSGSELKRLVPSYAFLGAPRYHAGGIAGLAPNEVPAILQRGERVLPAGSANGGVKIEIINNTGQEVSTEKHRENGMDVTRIVVGAVSTDIRRGGPVAHALQQVFGVRRQGVSHA